MFYLLIFLVCSRRGRVILTTVEDSGTFELFQLGGAVTATYKYRGVPAGHQSVEYKQSRERDLRVKIKKVFEV